MNTRSGWKRPVCLLALIGVILGGLTSLAAPSVVPAVIERNYEAAHRQYELKPNDNDAAWLLGKACFDRAEFARDDAERASLANEGGAACRKLIARAPNLAAGHYYLALNLAQLARTKLMGALALLGEMASECKASINLDETMDYAGADRFLGLLYRDAPGWPLSLGDYNKARRYMERAARLSPNYPENDLNLAETYLDHHDYDAAARVADKLRVIWPAARKEFTGEYWAVSWADWIPRYEKIQGRLASWPRNMPYRVDRRGNLH
jgi:tetratricopeptide (TPR) repeat protein